MLLIGRRARATEGLTRPIAGVSGGWDEAVPVPEVDAPGLLADAAAGSYR